MYQTDTIRPASVSDSQVLCEDTDIINVTLVRKNCQHIESYAVILSARNRDGKMFQRASNAGLHFFLARVKFVPNFTLFCCKNELCCDFALFGVTLKALNL